MRVKFNSTQCFFENSPDQFGGFLYKNTLEKYGIILMGILCILMGDLWDFLRGLGALPFLFLVLAIDHPMPSNSEGGYGATNCFICRGLKVNVIILCPVGNRYDSFCG